MALLIGGFAINADAQAPGVKKPRTQNNGDNSIPSEKIDKLLGDFDTAIGKCEETNRQLQKVEKRLADIAKIEKSGVTGPARRLGLNQTNNKTKNTKESLQKEKAELERKYRDYYRKTDALKQSLSPYTKSMSSDQKTQFASLESRFSDLPSPITK